MSASRPTAGAEEPARPGKGKPARRAGSPSSPSARTGAPVEHVAEVTSLTERRRQRQPAEAVPVPAPPPTRRRRVAAAPPGRRSRLFVIIFGLVLVLNVVGLAMVLSASSVTAMDNGSPWTQFLKQLQWFTLGGVAMVLTLRRDYRRWRDHCGWGVVVVIVLLVLVVTPGLKQEVNGATRWLGRGSWSIQPAEFAKLALIVFWADLLARRGRWIEHARLTVVPVTVTFGIVAALVMKQPNLGTTIVIFVIMLTMLFVAGAPLRWLAAILAVGVAGASAALLLSPWRMDRLMAFRDPWADPMNDGYQPLEAQVAVAEGGAMGLGLGRSRAKWHFLPEADTDFIFSIIAEETGLIGGLLVIALFLALAIAGTLVAVRAPDRFGMLLAAGITTWFLTQAFLNIGQAVGRLPVMGVPLPFVSSGGSSLVVGMVAAGMLLSVARQAR